MKQEILDSNLETVEAIGDFKSYSTSIDAEDLSWILQILSTNLYSDPIGSLVREYSSNAWDANVEAGNADKPIEVGIYTNKDEGTVWYVTDLGLGISPERIDSVYRKFGKSTKRASNESIGMMGLGKFSGLSYTNTVFIITRHNGIEYSYIMHKASGVPSIDLLSSVPTTKPSGTTIKIKLTESWQEKGKFINAVKNQLCYFENVYFNIEGEENLNQEFALLKGKTFTISTLSTETGLKIKLGPVSYPIDWDILEDSCTSGYDVHSTSLTADNYRHIALNFEIGELAITPNREAILYNQKTVENIVKRLTEFNKEFAELYDKQCAEIEDPNIYISTLNSPVIYLPIKNIVCKYQLCDQSIKLTTKSPTFKDFPYPLKINSIQEFFTDFQMSKTRVSGGRRVTNKYKWNFPSILGKNYLYIDDIKHYSPKKIEYICHKEQSSTFQIITKSSEKTPLKGDGFKDTSYYKILDLRKVPKSKWRERIIAYQKLQEKVLKECCLDYKGIEIDPVWLESNNAKIVSNKNAVSIRKIEGKILIKEISPKGWNSKCLVKSDVKINTLPDSRHITVYGTEDDRDNLYMLYDLFIDTDVKFWVTAKLNHKYLKQCKNYISYEDFIKGKTRIFKKVITFTYFKCSENTSIVRTMQLLDSATFRKKLLDINSSLTSKVTKYAGLLIHKPQIIEAQKPTIKHLYLEMKKTTGDDVTVRETIEYLSKVICKYDFIRVLNNWYSFDSLKDYGTLSMVKDLATHRKLRLNNEWYGEEYRKKVELLNPLEDDF